MDTDLNSQDTSSEVVIRLDEDDATSPGSTSAAEGGEPTTPGPHEDAFDPDNQRQTDEFVDATFLGTRAMRPDSGWRRLVFDASRGRINPGPSERQQQDQRLLSRIRRPITGCQRVAVLSRKGGVGKTTVTLCLGHTLASLRRDRTVAIDANPDAGTLAYRLADVGGGTITDLVRDSDDIRRYSDARLYTALAPSRLEVVASDDDPAITQAVTDDEYRTAVDVLERHYNLVLTDTGTDLTHSVMAGVLSVADALVLVVQPSIDGARHSAKTLDWLDAHGYEELTGKAVAVINGTRARSLVDIDRVWAHFAGRVRAVVTVPWDPQLEAGGQIYLEDLAEPTRRAYARVAGAVMDGLAPLRPLEPEAPTAP